MVNLFRSLYICIIKNGGETMKSLWFIFGFAVTTVAIIATEKITDKIQKK